MEVTERGKPCLQFNLAAPRKKTLKNSTKFNIWSTAKKDIADSIPIFDSGGSDWDYWWC
jgi:hypothetical protein